MTESEAKNIREYLKSGSTFAVLSVKNPDEIRECEFLAREAIREAVISSGAAVLISPDAPKEFRNKWKEALPPDGTSSIPYSTSILIPKNKIDIKEITYADDADYFTISIKSGESPVEASLLSFSRNPLTVDQVFTLEPVSYEALSSLFEEKIILPGKENAIFISGESSVRAGGVYALLKSLGDNFISKKTATLLFASLLSETENWSRNVNEDTLNLGAMLLRHGADKPLVSEIIKREFTYPLAQLLGRALARTRVSNDLESVWVFLSEQDLEKTGFAKAEESVFSSILEKIQELVPPEPLYILLVQKDNAVTIMGKAAEGERPTRLISLLADKLGLAHRSELHISTNSYQNFSEAELAAQEALKESLLSYTM